METLLDKALQSARQNQDRESGFYNLFLRTDLFIPTWELPKESKEKRAAEGDTIAPVITESQ